MKISKIERNSYITFFVSNSIIFILLYMFLMLSDASFFTSNDNFLSLENNLILINDVNKEEYSKIETIIDNDKYSYNLFNQEVTSNLIYSDGELSPSKNILYVSNNVFDTPIFNINKTYFTNLEVIDGELISPKYNERDNVVVIDKKTSKYLFKDKNPIGKIIEIPKYNYELDREYIEEFNVIGVVNDLSSLETYSETDILLEDEAIDDKYLKSSNIQLNYVVLDTNTEYRSYIVSGKLNDLDKLYSTIKDLGFSSIYVNEEKSHILFEYEELIQSKTFTILMLSIILIINLYSTMTMIINSQIRTIAIKRSIGANTEQVFKELILKLILIIYSSLLLSLIICYIILYMIKIIGNELLVIINPFSIYFVTLIILFISTVGIIIVYFLIKNINISDQLKSE